MSKVTLKDRTQYPFISSDGKLSLVSQAVDDISLWVYPGVKMPLIVNAYVDTGSLKLSINDETFTYSATAHADSGYIKSDSGDIVGTILWNTDGVDILKSTIIGNDPQPYTTLYVNPSACSVYQKPVLSTVRINGDIVDGGIINILVDNSSGIVSNVIGESGTRLDLYGDSITKVRVPIDTIVFKSREDSDSEDSDSGNSGKNVAVQIIQNIDGDVWIHPEPGCDIRVITDNSIIITEVSNDRI